MPTIIAQNFSYVAPRSQDELVDLLATREGAQIIAGGTDLIVDLRSGSKRPQVVIDIKKVAGYRDIGWDEDGSLRLGPCVTINQVLFDPEIAKRHPLLVACAADLASHQIRNRATVAGNVVNASPCADMAPAMLCSRAVAVVTSRDGERRIPFSQFFTGVKRTVLERHEVLSAIVIPPESADAQARYRKLKRIRGHDLGIVGVAIWRKDDEIRAGVSSSAPTPLLIEGLGERDSVDEMVDTIRAAISPITDVRCTADYREHMVTTFARRLLEEVA